MEPSQEDNRRFYRKDRLILKKAFPTTPYFMLVDFHNQCNQKCVYCPRLIEPRIDMDMDLWIKILKDYKDLAIKYNYPDRGRIGIGGFCEPFLDDSVWDYVEEAKKLGVADMLYFNTNGTTWTEETIDKLIGYLDDFTQYKTLLTVHIVNKDSAITTQKIIERIPNLRDATICPVIPGGAMWSPYSVPILSRMGLLWNVDEQEILRCSGEEPYIKIVIRPTGDVLFCCNDFHYKWVIGNLTHNTIQEVWNGKRRLELLDKLEHGGKGTPCLHCEEAMSQGDIDIVDNALEKSDEG